ncbi:hypothetical protein BJ170DRAFT_679319 [Xylariales sp. AK1849]|nr:hypothetical protein BJ170DRAFT_679319 [Xylariales sp. AK1849]
MVRDKGLHTKHLDQEQRFRVRVLYFDAAMSKKRIKEVTGYTESQIRLAISAKSASVGVRTGRPKKGAAHNQNQQPAITSDAHGYEPGPSNQHQEESQTSYEGPGVGMNEYGIGMLAGCSQNQQFAESIMLLEQSNGPTGASDEALSVSHLPPSASSGTLDNRAGSSPVAQPGTTIADPST